MVWEAWDTVKWKHFPVSDLENIYKNHKYSVPQNGKDWIKGLDFLCVIYLYQTQELYKEKKYFWLKISSHFGI